MDYCILLVFLLLIPIGSVGAIPENLYYSDQIEHGQVYSWYKYNQYYNETDIHNAGIGTNLTLEVIQDPHGTDARAIAEGDYFKSYVNESYKSYNPISRFNSELIDPNTLLQPVIVNETQNYFKVLDEQ